MVGCIATISAALGWLLYESDWLRLRLPMGPTITFCPFTPRNDVKHLCYQWFDRAGNFRDNGSQKRITLTRDHFEFPKQFFSPGITEPLCGWDWIEGRTHPMADYRITITAWGITHKIAIASDDPRLLKEVFAIALKPDKTQRRALTVHKAAARKANASYAPVPEFVY